MNRESPFCAPSAFGLGGEWGWIELDGAPGATSGDADMVDTFCLHTPGFTGAFHFNADGFWTTISLPSGPFPGLTDPAGKYLVITGAEFPLPATSGHYTINLDRGVFGQIQIQRIPGR